SLTAAAVQAGRGARLVDERMRAVADGLAVHDVAKVAVLPALNLADELEGLKSFSGPELREVLDRARAEEEEVVDPEPPAPEAFAQPEPAEETAAPAQEEE